MATVTYSVCFILLTVYSSISLAEKPENADLLFIQLLWRHGDRSPIMTYPNDPNPEGSWKEGFGQLTLLGKKQHYALGKFLRKMYDGFVTSNPTEVKVQSSEEKRCLESAQSNLASFYAPTKEWQFESTLNWQPIPIYYAPAIIDKYLRIDSYCPAAIKEKERMLNSKTGQDANKEYEEMFKYLSEHSGLDIKDWGTALLFFDTLKAEKKYNLTIPPGANKYWNQLNNLTHATMFWNFHSPIILRLKSGPLIGKMVENMADKINNKLPDQKVQIFSAHDVNIAAILQALDIFNMKQPPFCATLIVELYQVNTSHVVRFLYLNSSTPESGNQYPNVLILNGCTEYCPFEFVLSYTEHLITVDWDVECNAELTDFYH